MSDIHVADGGISFLAHLLAASDTVDDPDYKNTKVDSIVTFGPKVVTRLVTPSGDTYRVTVEWLSEESP